MAIRASRLTGITLLLEARGRVTAPELAAEFGVSVRTIFRDMEALAGAGVPVYAERGAAGGYRLVEGHRMRPPGLTAEEAQALWLAGQPEAAARIGLGPALRSAEAKLLAVLGTDQRGHVNRLRERLYIEGGGWFGEAEEPAHLACVMEAVWEGCAIRVRYQSWAAERMQALEPLGLVLKGGLWYLVAQRPGDATARTYRVSRILACETLDERVRRPSAFNLGAHWRQSSAEFVARMYPLRAKLRVSPEGMRRLHHLGSALHVAGMSRVGEPDGAGWQLVTVPFENVSEAASDLLRLGVDIDVVAPKELREAMRTLASAVLRFLEASPSISGADDV